jgi:hypothetical protein
MRSCPESLTMYSPLLDLPRELRDFILDYAICQHITVSSITHVPGPNHSMIKEHNISPIPSLIQHQARGLLYTCHQLRAETIQRSEKYNSVVIDMRFSGPEERGPDLVCTVMVPLQITGIGRSMEKFKFGLQGSCLERAKGTVNLTYGMTPRRLRCPWEYGYVYESCKGRWLFPRWQHHYRRQFRGELVRSAVVLCLDG